MEKADSLHENGKKKYSQREKLSLSIKIPALVNSKLSDLMATRRIFNKTKIIQGMIEEAHEREVGNGKK